MSSPLVRLIDDDEDFRRSQRMLLAAFGFDVREYGSAIDFLASDQLQRPGCLVLDIRMPGMTGIELQQKLLEADVGAELPIIFLTGHGDVQTAVHTLKTGAFDFIEKRGDPMALKDAVERACRRSLDAFRRLHDVKERQAIFDTLTQRERDVLFPSAAGATNKAIGASLGIGVETVKMHRANAFGKLGVQSALEAYQWLQAWNPDKLSAAKSEWDSHQNGGAA